MSNPDRRYCAFISYRHADNAQEGRRWAEWLHRALERYVVPPDLVGTRNERGETIPASLYPIFRDETDLPANPDLTTGIRAALERSDHLIVLCSPRSAVSPWVRKEVREWKELGRSDRLLAIMLAGEPNADDPAKVRDGILPEEECFCHELRFGVPQPGGAIDWSARTQPLAADLRPGGLRAEGFVNANAYREHLTLHSALATEKICELSEAYHSRLELGLLKIIAGLLGVALSQLTERDAAYRAAQAEQELARQRQIAQRERQYAGRLHRRNRILLLTAAAVLLFALAAVWLGLIAEAARTEAERQQAAAEWERLRAQSGEEEADEAKLHAIAAKEAADELIRFLQYDLNGTMEKLEMLQSINERIRRYQEQHPPAPGDAAAVAAAERARSAVLDQRGDIQLAQRDFPAALQSYHESLAIREKLARQDPAHVDWRRDLSHSFDKLGNVQCAQGAFSAALQSYRDSFAIREKLARQNPAHADCQRDLFLSFINLGDVQRAQGDLPAALLSYRDSLAIAQKLAQQEPANAERQRDLYVILFKVGDTKQAQGDLPAALQSYRDSLAITQKLTLQDPANVGWQHDFSSNLTVIGEIEEERKNFFEALALYRQVLAIDETLTSVDPTHAMSSSEVAWYREAVARVTEMIKSVPLATPARKRQK